MQHFIPSASLRPVPDDDAFLTGTEETLPPPIILDFIYGAAAYRCWKAVGNVHKQLQAYFSSCYQPALEPPQIPFVKVVDISSDGGSIDDGDHSSDEDYQPSGTLWTPLRKEMLNAMDKVNLIMMKIHGTTPEEVAMKTQKKLEQVELEEQEASQVKVLEWMESSDSDAF